MMMTLTGIPAYNLRGAENPGRENDGREN